jgi:hypothetical protein
VSTAPLTRLHPDELTAVLEASRTLQDAVRQAERAALRAKVAVMDAEEAVQAVYAPIAARHGLDPAQPVRVLDNGDVVPAESGR